MTDRSGDGQRAKGHDSHGLPYSRVDQLEFPDDFQGPFTARALQGILTLFPQRIHVAQRRVGRGDTQDRMLDSEGHTVQGHVVGNHESVYQEIHCHFCRITS